MDQNLKLNHYFLEKSTTVGNDVHYILTIDHPQNLNLFLPKTKNFLGDFEITKKSYFPTKTNEEGISKDSIIYTLKLFSNKEVNWLEIPIYSSNGIDCTKIEVIRDSILLKSALNGEEFQLEKYYESLEIEPLPAKYNYTKILGIGITVLISALIIYSLLKKPIQKNLNLFYWWRENRKFKKNFERELELIRTKENKSELIGKIFLGWKEYLEKVGNLPITTYTSKEIIEELRLKKRKKNLNNIDAAIYGSIFNENCLNELSFLFEISQEWYQKKIQEIKEK